MPEILTALGLLFAGVFLGFLLAALCQAGSRADRDAQLTIATDLLRAKMEDLGGAYVTPEWYVAAHSLLREYYQTPTPETAKP